MKTSKLILCFVAMATMLLAGCGKDNNGDNSGSDALIGTTWSLHDPNDQIYHADVVYTVAFGQGDDLTFTRVIDFGSTVTTVVMTGTYSYNNNSGIAWMYNEGETAEYRFTFTVSGNTMKFTFNMRDVTLLKQ